MVRILLGLLVAAHLPVASVLAQKSATLPSGKPARSKTIRGQKPVTGSGIVLIDVDYRTGRVTAARMLKSTGHAVLDDAAVNGFRKWKFKPKTKSPFTVPISFTLTGTQL